jgi:uncharacterized protein YhbP (UPF0306 family)
MSEIEEPALAGLFPETTAEEDPGVSIQDQIRALMFEQPYAVLCTQGGGQPYGSVIAFAVNQDLNAAVFATPTATRKFRLLSECDQVALVVDNRSADPGEISHIHAVTATGRAVDLSKDDAEDHWQKLLIDKHPVMHDFVCAPSTALIRIDILRYFHVTRLQEVYQWAPPPPSR